MRKAKTPCCHANLYGYARMRCPYPSSHHRIRQAMILGYQQHCPYMKIARATTLTTGIIRATDHRTLQKAYTLAGNRHRPFAETGGGLARQPTRDLGPNLATREGTIRGPRIALHGHRGGNIIGPAACPRPHTEAWRSSLRLAPAFGPRACRYMATKGAWLARPSTGLKLLPTHPGIPGVAQHVGSPNSLGRWQRQRCLLLRHPPPPPAMTSRRPISYIHGAVAW
jgi:hypothetical protein